MKRYVKTHAMPLLENGYSITPITTIDWTMPVKGSDERQLHPAAGKAPVFKEWATKKVDREVVEEWQAKKFIARCGLGIRTWHTPAVDVDCTDVDASKYMRNFIESLVGFAPARVGRQPKILLLYRTEQPFSKVKSRTWLDEWGDRQAVEILGAGQQFVAYGIHPGTKSPYQWISEDTPLNNHASMDLEVIDLHMARQIVDEFDRYAEAQGWTIEKPNERPPRGALMNGDETHDVLEVDEDDWVDADDVKEKWHGTYAELESLMEQLPPAEDYGDWFPVLAALKDAENEPDEFKEIAREWSARAENYDEDYFETKWDQGSFNRAGGFAFTVKSIQRKVEDLQMETDVLETIVPAFERADNLKEWDLAAMRLRETPVWGTIRDFAVEKACDEYKRITGKKIPPTTKKAALSVDHKQFEAPAWIEPWIFAETQNAFVNKNTLTRVVPHAFNNANAQHTQHLGCTPEVYATALRPVPVVYSTMYLPSHHGEIGHLWKPVPGIEGKEFFRHNGHVWLNTFKPSSLPAVAEKMSRGGQKAVKVMLDFFRVQFPEEKEYQYVMDWLAWVINNPTKRISYALLILGGQGSGKSIVKKFMQYMLGAENVGTVNNQVIHKSFTGWQSGSILKVIEEISVAGHRFDVINALKEPITNETLFIERKNENGVEEVNTASWMMYTNDIAALPVNKNDRRFLIVRSFFRSKSDVAAYLFDNPDFFKDFEKAFTKYASEIRLWFKDWEYAPDFSYNNGHAPQTDAGEDMVDNAQDDFSVAVMDAIQSEEVPGMTSELIHSFFLTSHIPREIRPSDRFIASRLADLGYVKLGKGRVVTRVNGARGTVYARNPKLWMKDKNTVDGDAVREHLEKQISAVAAKEVADTWED